MKANECIFFQLAKANQLGSRLWGKKISDLGITAVQGMVVSFLFEEDGVTSVMLGNKTELDSSTITGVLDRLESSGLIERRNNPCDRRSILVFLTQKGRIVGEKVKKRMEEANREFLKELNNQEVDELRHFISKIRNSR